MSSVGGLRRYRRARRRITLLAWLAAVTYATTGLTAPHPVSAGRPPGPHPQLATPCVLPHTGINTVQVDGRSLALYVPRGAKATKRLPLLLLLHGTGGTGEQQLRASKLMRTADRFQFLIAAPNGSIKYGKGFAWKVPGVPLLGGFRTPPNAPDDVRYLTSVAHTLTGATCGDPHRVYASGFSGGARMTSELGCAAADTVAAIAPVSGLRAGTPDAQDNGAPDARTCKPSRPVGVFAVHGTGDKTNLFRGGGQKYWRYSVPEALGTWVGLDRCTLRMPDVQLSRSATLIDYVSCGGNGLVQLLRITGGKHQWPLDSASVNPGLDVNTLLWTSLAHYRR